jgi:hypothetical protein
MRQHSGFDPPFGTDKHDFRHCITSLKLTGYRQSREQMTAGSPAGQNNAHL